jgi:hypothetical protein
MTQAAAIILPQKFYQAHRKRGFHFYGIMTGKNKSTARKISWLRLKQMVRKAKQRNRDDKTKSCYSLSAWIQTHLNPSIPLWLNPSISHMVSLDYSFFALAFNHNTNTLPINFAFINT